MPVEVYKRKIRQRFCKKCAVLLPVGSTWKERRGKFCSHACRYKGRNPKGKDHHMWVGNYAKYVSLHSWIRDNWGRAFMCQNLGCKRKSETFDWANVDGKYDRERPLSWMMLCRLCHRGLDYQKSAVYSPLVLTP